MRRSKDVVMAVFAVLMLAVHASEGVPVSLRPSFEGGRQSHYEGRTRALTGAAAEGADFVVVCTKTSVCETAWGIYSRPVPVAKEATAYALEFEIRADCDWINPETSGKMWDNAIDWLDAGGGLVERRRLSLEFRKGAFARFRFVGAVPKGAAKVEVQFGVDGPNLPPGEKVCVRNLRLTLLAEGDAVPDERIPDLRAPIVRSRFTSPSEDANVKATYEITDYTAVDWSSVAVTDAVKKVAVPFVRDGNRITLAPGAPWETGRQLVDVTVRDILGNAAVARKAFLVGERPRRPAVTLRDDGMALVDGKPFFPIGMYAVSPYDFNSNSFDVAVRDLKKAGLNLMHSYGDRFSPELFAAAAKHGVMQWTDGKGAGREKDLWFMTTGRVDRTVLAWYIGDDTSMNTTPGQLLDRDEAARMIDGTRITCHADGVRAKAAKSNYQEYVNYADVFMPEIYPIDGFKDERCVAEVCRDMDRCWADIRKYGDGSRNIGVWPILQCFHGKGWKRYPTAQEMYAMSFAAIIHGGNGITWFKYGGEIGEKGTRYSGMFRTPEDWVAMTNITARIACLSPMLLERTPPQPPVPEIVEGPKRDPLGKPAVTLLLKRRKDVICLMAVNAANEKVRARFNLGPLKAAQVGVSWEGRTVALSQGVFEDDFEPFGVHVYKLVVSR
jgi:hypothetical protein